MQDCRIGCANVFDDVKDGLQNIELHFILSDMFQELYRAMIVRPYGGSGCRPTIARGHKDRPESYRTSFPTGQDPTERVRHLLTR